MKRYLLLALLLVSTAAHAQIIAAGTTPPAAAPTSTLTLTWTNPTTNADTSVIPATGPGSLASATMSYGPCAAGNASLASITGTVLVTEPATTAVSPVLTPGTWCGEVDVTNTYGKTSLQSAVASKVIAAPTPNPATGVTAS